MSFLPLISLRSWFYSSLSVLSFRFRYSVQGFILCFPCALAPFAERICPSMCRWVFRLCSWMLLHLEYFAPEFTPPVSTLLWYYFSCNFVPHCFFSLFDSLRSGLYRTLISAHLCLVTASVFECSSCQFLHLPAEQFLRFDITALPFSFLPLHFLWTLYRTLFSSTFTLISLSSTLQWKTLTGFACFDFASIPLVYLFYVEKKGAFLEDINLLFVTKVWSECGRETVGKGIHRCSSKCCYSGEEDAGLSDRNRVLEKERWRMRSITSWKWVWIVDKNRDSRGTVQFNFKVLVGK